MKAGVYYNNKDVRVEEKPVPEVGDKEILIKVMACGICGSDVLEWYRIKKAPLVLGHELAGEIVKTGKGSDFKVGDRVFATHHVPCGECRYCKTGHETSCEVFHGENNFTPGGFSQFLKVSGRSLKTGVFKLPKNMSYEMGTFIEPLGTVVRGQRTAGTIKGDTVLVIGSGITGILHIMLAKELGAANIIATDINEYRLEAAKKAGANFVINAKQDVPAEVKKVNGGRPADKVIICAGALPAAEQAIQSVDKGGTILFFAVPLPGEKVAIDFTPFWRNDISIRTSYGAAPRDNEEAIKLLSSGKIKATDIITHRFGLDRISDGFMLVVTGKGLKVIIKPNNLEKTDFKLENMEIYLENETKGVRVINKLLEGVVGKSVILSNQDFENVINLMTENFYFLEKHYLKLSEGKIEKSDVDIISYSIMMHYLYMYNSWRETYPRHKNKNLKFIKSDLNHPGTYDLIFWYLEKKYPDSWLEKAAILMNVTLEKCKKIKKQREDFEKMW